MKIVLITVGKIKKGYIKTGAAEYVKRIKRYSPVEIVEIKEEAAPPAIQILNILEKEAKRILENVKQGDFVIALGDRGIQYSSGKFAEFINKLSSSGKRRIIFIVGGAYGLHPSILEGSDLILSLSPMTFPHDLARLVLLEQVYRAFTILRSEPYSH
ncbi:MAG: 23S rRNA (pseudouridine(1915)-N(3))-methyltransferase RlmH [Deltaproteobacteria bacterium]|nr:23S rRNA (pseudouridine(1915)-N(3))-methyltransferase RlmH [Deltaproteobacteria bacterium]